VDLKAILRGQAMGAVGTGDLISTEERLKGAFGTCVTMKPDVHSFRGNKAMNRIGG
jgi:hypothetical protein